MKSLDNAVEAVLKIDTSGEREVSRAGRTIKKFSDKLKRLGATSASVSEAQRRMNDEISDTATASGQASGGLAGLQTQLVQTRAAQEALADESRSLDDALVNLGDDADGVIDVLSGSLQGGSATFGDDLNEVLDSLEESDIEDVLHNMRDVSNFEFDDLEIGDWFDDFVDEAFDPDQVSALEDTIRDAIAEGVDPEDAVLDEFPDLFKQADASNIEVHNFTRALSNIDTDGAYVLEETFEAISENADTSVDELEAFRDLLKDLESRGALGDISALRGEPPTEPSLAGILHDDPDAYESLRTDDRIGELVDSEEGIDKLLEMDDGELAKLAKENELFDIEPPDGYRSGVGGVEDILNTDDFFDGNVGWNVWAEGGWEARQDLHNAILEEYDSIDDSSQISDKLINSFAADNKKKVAEIFESHTDGLGEGYEEYASEIRDRIHLGRQSMERDRDEYFNEINLPDDEIAEYRRQVKKFSKKNGDFTKKLRQASSGSDIDEIIDDLDGDNLLQIQRLLNEHGEDLLNITEDTDQIQKILGRFSTRSDLWHEMSDQDLKGINEAQNAILTQAFADLDTRFISGEGRDITSGEFRPEALDITREGLGLHLVDQYLNTDSKGQQENILGLMEQLGGGFLDDELEMGSLLDTESFQQTLADEMSGRLPDDISERMMGDGSTFPEKLAERIGQSSSVDSIEGLLENPEEIDEIVGDVAEQSFDSDGDDPARVISQTEKSIEESLRSSRRRQADLVAPGLTTGLQGTDKDLSDLLPTGLSGDDKESAIKEFRDAFTDSVEAIDEAIESSPILQGSYDVRGNRRGLFGKIMEFTAGRASPRRLDQVRKSLDGIGDKFEKMVPLLTASSLQLGPLSIGFETLGVMAFKLTATLGPLIASLFGVAGAALAAAAGFMAFAGVGAIGFLGQMEDQMAGVNSKMEAMKELAKTLGGLAWEALRPLQEATLADGTSSMDLFVSTIRGGLRWLRQFANAMAHMAELPVVVKQLDRFSDIIFGQDGAWAEGFGETLEKVLPIVVDIFGAIVNGLPGFMRFVSNITDELVPSLMKAGDHLSEVLAMMSLYGTGFLKFSIEAVAAIGLLLTSLIDLVEMIPLVGDHLGGLVYGLGAFIGIVGIAIRTVSFMTSTLINLAGILGGAARGAGFLTAKLQATTLWANLAEKSLLGVARAAAIATAQFLVVAAAVAVVVDLFKVLIGQESFLAEMLPYDSWESFTGIMINMGVVLAGLITLMNYYNVSLGTSAISTNTLTAATSRLNMALLTTAGTLAILTAGFIALADLVQMIGGDDSFIAQALGLDHIPRFVQALGLIATFLASILAVIAKIGGAMAVIKAVAVPIAYVVYGIYLLFKGIAIVGGVIAGVIGTILGSTVALIAILAGIVIVFMDLVHYALYGESILTDWFEPLEGIYDWILKNYEKAKDLVSVLNPSNWGGLGSIGLGGFSVPFLASGGIVDSATLAMIGEEGSEAVVPLDKMEKFLGTAYATGQAETAGMVQQTSKFVSSPSSSGGKPSGGTTAKPRGGGGPDHVTVEVNNSGVIGDKNFKRMIRREAENVVDRVLNGSYF